MGWLKNLFKKRNLKAFTAVNYKEEPVRPLRKVEITEDGSMGVNVIHNTTDDDALSLINRARMDLMLKPNSN